MLMADGSAVRRNGVGNGRLELLPAFKVRGKATGRSGPDKLRIDTAALRVQMRQVREGVHALAILRKNIARRLLHGQHQLLHVGPVHRSLDRVGTVALVPQRVAQVRAFETVACPLRAHGSTDVDRAVCRQGAPRFAQGVARVAVLARDAEHQQAFAFAAAAQGQVAFQPADQPGVAGQREAGLGLNAIAESRHAQRQPALDQRAHSGFGGVPVWQKNGVKTLVLGQWADAHRDLGQNAKATFRAHHQFAHVRAGAGGGQRGNRERADRGFHMAACKQLLNASVAQRLLAAGTRHHPAPHRGVFKRLRKMPQRIALGAQLRFQLRARCAGAKGGELAQFVQVQQPVHSAQVDRQNGALADRAIEMA